jgi:5-methylcytosine-specific restriction protein A
MTIMRACVVCARPSRESYCPAHTPKPWATSNRKHHVSLSGSAQQARAKRVLARDFGLCHVCGQAGADQVDHVIALAHGGADSEGNLAAIHAEPRHRAKTQAEARSSRSCA